MQDPDDLPWSGRYVQKWNKYAQNNLCGYDVVIFQEDRKQCNELFMQGVTQQLIVASVQDSYSLDNIEERVLEKDDTFNLNTDLILTFRNGNAFITGDDGCIQYLKVDNIHVIYSGTPQYIQINVG